MLTKWGRDPYGICGLVLTPTRELAMQIAEQFLALGAIMNIKVSLIIGGVDMMEQCLELQRKPHFVIATPGRLADHIKSSGEETTCGLRRIKHLVLDEADRLLSSSFEDDLDICLSLLPKKRQTLLFTATVTDAIRSIKENTKDKDIFMHEIGDEHDESDNEDEKSEKKSILPSTLTQTYLFGPSYVKEAYLYGILASPDNLGKNVIVFVNRTRSAEMLRRMLQLLSIRSNSLHSEMPQSERTNALGRFRAQVARVLVATDVASRGLDIPTVEMVINFDIPADADDYVHRVGRTARAGRTGESISLVSELDVDRIQNIESRVNSKMELYTAINDTKVIEHYLKDASTAKRQAIMEMEKENFGEKRRIQKLKRMQKNKAANK
jgi:ATP-dependent RNA helicase DDX49/DBP8